LQVEGERRRRATKEGNMNCQAMEENLIAYLDGKATAAERRAVEAHLADCAACRARAEEFRAVWNVLDDAPEHALSPSFDARLRQRIAAEAPRRWFDGWLPQPRLAFALSLLLALAVWIGKLPGPAPDVTAQNDEEFKMIQELQVLEDLDVLANFEVLSNAEAATRPVAKKPETKKL
jgi:anti-sigma factor ChrR (cupin superfamily)